MKACGWLFGVIIAMLMGCRNSEQGNMYGFTIQNWKARLAGFPREDSYAYDEERKIACVADGITRDFLDGTSVTHDLEGLIKSWKGLYPDYAQKASRICTETFMKTKSFSDVIGEIGSYTLEEGLIFSGDYLARDFAGCVAAGFFEEKGKINWSFIADSGVAVIESNGDLKFRTPDEGPHSQEKNPYLENVLKEAGGWLNPEGRRIIRSKYRNNPEEPFAYGALTGEENALHYIRKGVENVDLGDYVLVFTDGVRDIIFNKNPRIVSKYECAPKLNIDGIPEPSESLIIPPIKSSFFEVLKEGNPFELKKFCQKRVSTEGTLVVWKVD